MKPTSLDDMLGRARQLDADVRVLVLSPLLAKMPLPMQRYDEPFLPLSKAIIDATRDLVSGYIFDLAAYLALGAAGAIALERAIAYAGAGSETLTILHGAFVGANYAQAAAAFNVDAVTLVSSNPEVDRDRVAVYNSAGVGVFLLEHTGKFPDGFVVQNGEPFRLWIVGSDVIYAGSGDDFAEQARAALQSWRPEQ